MKKALVIALFSVTCVSATTITLDMNSLPSNQGWDYNATGLLEGYAETNIASTDGSVLTMDTMDASYSGGTAGSATYRYFDVDNSEPLTILEWTSRTLEHEADPGYPLGFFAGFIVNNLQVTAGIHTNQISLMDGDGKKLISIDATVFHTYRIVAAAGTPTYDFYIDGTLETSVAKRSVNLSNRVTFGDGTGGANAKAEISSLAFSQIPEPASVALLALFSGGIYFVRRLFMV